MILLVLVAVPLLSGVTTWIVGDRRLGVGSVVAFGGVTTTLLAAIAAALAQPARDIDWGAGLTLGFEVNPIARGPLVLVPVVALAVVVYASGYGEPSGRARLLGLLTIFVGIMELLLIAADLMTLIVAWELVGVVSWALIAHHWREDAPAHAAPAFLVTRVGDLGLFLSAGAVFAATGSLRFSSFAAFVGGGGLAGSCSRHSPSRRRYRSHRGCSRRWPVQRPPRRCCTPRPCSPPASTSSPDYIRFWIGLHGSRQWRSVSG
jgi:NADH-quinone oxidoreductase subunit L